MSPIRLAAPARIAVAAILCWAMAGCHRQARDVVLISLDTVRADIFSEALRQAPELRAWVSSSRTFDRAFAPTPFTLSSHMTVFTGLAPWIHGVNHADLALSSRIETLPEILHRKGYRTVGVANSPWLDGSFGFARGFDSYRVLPTMLHAAPEVTRLAMEEVHQVSKSDPLFLFLHFYDAHSDTTEDGNVLPYFSPSPDPSRTDAQRDQQEFCDAKGRCATDYLLAADLEGRQVSPSKVEAIKQLYTRGVVSLERDVGMLLRTFESDPRMSRALVILFADHGEEFREHGRFLHSQVYLESTRVPLVVHGGGPPGHSTTPVELSDIFRTVVDASTTVAPNSQMGGVDLLSERPGAGQDRSLLSRDKLHEKVWAVRHGDWAMVWDGRIGRGMLFDDQRDSLEKRNLAPDQPQVAAALMKELRSRMTVELREARRFPPKPEKGTLSAAEIARLRALGYLH